MKTYSFLIAFFGILSIGMSQSEGLTIEYNLFDEQVKYKRENAYIEEPFVRSGENIYVIVQEFNPFTTIASIDATSVDYSQRTNATSNGIDSYAGGEFGYEDDYYSGGGGGGFNTGGLLGGLGLGGGITDALSLIPGSRGAQSKSMLKLQRAFNTNLKRLNVTEEKINLQYEKLLLFNKAQLSRELALHDIEKLKRNTSIKPSRVREMIEEEIRYAFSKTKDEDIDIDDIVDRAGRTETIRLTVNEYKHALNEYRSLKDDWISLAEMFKIEEFENDTKMVFLENSTDTIIQTIDRNISTFDNAAVDQILEIDLVPDVQLLASLRQVYEELQSRDFEHNFSPVQASGDEMVLQLNFQQKDENGTYIPYKGLKQVVPVTGQWKTKGGVGFAFGALAGDQFDYAIENGTIVGNKKDAFIPHIASFVHFYKQNNKSFNLAGSFGAGLPLQNTTDLKSISFFLGPSLMIGKGEKFLITGGVMGGKSNQLNNDLQIGDFYDGVIETLPVSSSYKFGYFISVSFGVI